MRIVSVISGLGYGGAETQLILICTELIRQGHQACIYLLTDHAPRLEQARAAGIEVVVDNKRSRLDLAVLLRLRKWLRNWRPDVVHGYLFDGNWYATVAALGTALPVLCSERSSDYRLSRAQQWVHVPVRRFVSGLVANSERGRQQAQILFGLPGSHTHLVANGLDLAEIDRRLAVISRDLRKQIFGPGSERVVVLVGSFNEAKDQLLAIEVLRHLVGIDSRWQMSLVGTSFGDRLDYANAVADASVRYELTVRKRVATLGLEGHVCFLGQRKDALEVISQADVLLTTSRREGSPNVVLEAMAAGTPVVATSFSDIDRMLPCSWQVVADRNPQTLALALIKAFDQRKALVAEQRAWVESKADIVSTAHELLRIYAGYVADPQIACSTRSHS